MFQIRRDVPLKRLYDPLGVIGRCVRSGGSSDRSRRIGITVCTHRLQHSHLFQLLGDEIWSAHFRYHNVALVRCLIVDAGAGILRCRRSASNSKLGKLYGGSGRKRDGLTGRGLLIWKLSNRSSTSGSFGMSIAFS